MVGRIYSVAKTEISRDISLISPIIFIKSISLYCLIGGFGGTHSSFPAFMILYCSFHFQHVEETSEKVTRIFRKKMRPR